MALLFCLPESSYGQEYSSSSFTVRDSVIGVGGGRGTSSSFELFGKFGQIGIGESTSSNFQDRAFALYFPVATAPILIATAGDGSVSLGWTGSTGTLANVTSYEVGTATTSGGPYTYEPAGSVTSFTKTGLTNGTTYYLRVRALAAGLALASSNEASAIPKGSSGSSQSQNGNIRVTGYAVPNNQMTFLLNGVVLGTVDTNSAGFFEKTFTDISPGLKTFSLYSRDSEGRTTLTISTEITVLSGATVTLSGFLLPPTVGFKDKFPRPSLQMVKGFSATNNKVSIYVDNELIADRIGLDEAGKWERKLERIFSLGRHTIRVIAYDSNGNQSEFSQSLAFTVELSADLNTDQLINLVDFSILMFNYGAKSPSNKAADINDNGPVDLVDFSVMMFHWTGG